MLCHTSLVIYYQTIFAMAQHYGYQISEIESTMPYERDIYVAMLVEYIRKQEDSSRGL